MKSNTRNRHGNSGKAAVAEDLIRQVSESVVARSVGRRRGRGAAPVEAKKETPEARAPEVPVVNVPENKPPEAPVQPVAPPVPVEPPVLKSTAESKGGSSSKPALAIFCYVEPDCVIGRFITETAPLLAERGVPVHIFARHAFTIDAPGVKVHELGLCENEDLLASVGEYTLRALNAFLTEFSAESSNVSVLGFEWSSVGSLLELSRTKRAGVLLSLHSLECQRSDLSSAMSRKIQELEIQGLQCAGKTLVHNAEAAEAAGKRLPECRTRLVRVAERFPVEDFSSGLDAGVVKARYEVGPIDPTVLFVGNFDDRHGPDVLMKAVPAIVKNIPQARFIFVGDGPQQWPLRVHARYLLLEHAVRFTGHLEGKPLRELIEAADLICVPSRERTEAWPILAAWAAKRPVLTTQQMAGGWLKHEQDSVIIYAQENSCVWGVERVLFDETLRKKLSANGHQKLLEQNGWGRAAAQLEELMSAGVAG